MTPRSVAEGIVRSLERDRKVTVLPPAAGPLHGFRMAPQRLADAIMVGIPRSL
ncbi:MAG: hypothetical protein M0P31_06065 [Solirubrobacteraceae bacterium]|nr:hypothetical protein [Solirubrobacteraceae bacterium]